MNCKGCETEAAACMVFVLWKETLKREFAGMKLGLMNIYVVFFLSSSARMSADVTVSGFLKVNYTPRLHI